MWSEYFNSAHYFIQGSAYEGSGFSLIEAMACGCVPIITDILSFNKILGEEFKKLQFKHGDVEGLSKILLKLDEKEWQNLSDRMERRFKNELSFEAIANQMIAVIDTINKSTNL